MKHDMPDALAAAREEADRIRRLDFDPYEYQVSSVAEEVPWADPESPQGRYQRAKREKYRRRFNLPADGPDAVFWDACDRAERMLVERIRALGPVPRAEDVFRLFTTTWPDGLNKDGTKLHPEQVHEEYTWITHGTLIDERTYYRWERDERFRLPDQPLVFQY